MDDPLVQLSSLVTIHGHPVAPYVAAAGAVCLGLSTVMKPPTSVKSAYGLAYLAVNFVAFNFGQARNASAPKKDGG